MVIVLNSVGRRFLVFSNVRLTSANPLAERVRDPLNTRLSRFSERRWLIFCSPITQRILSTMFDFPHPLGPMIPVTPSSKFTIVLSAKLLKPLISKLFNRTVSEFKVRDKSNGTRLKDSMALAFGLVNYSRFVHKKHVTIKLCRSCGKKHGFSLSLYPEINNL